MGKGYTKEEIRKRKKAAYAKKRRRLQGILTRTQTAWKKYGRKRKYPKKPKTILGPTTKAMLAIAHRMRRTGTALRYADLAYLIAQRVDKPEMKPLSIQRLARRLHKITKGKMYILRILLDGEYFYVSL